MNHEPSTQVCVYCEEELPLDQFHRNRQAKSGYKNICRVCRSQTRTDFHNLPTMEDRLDSITFNDLLRFADLYIEDLGSGCWNWCGATSTGGYPVMWHRGGKLYSHRFAVAAHGTTFDLDADIHHRCGNRICVNPSHLEPLDSHTHQRLHAEKRKKANARNRLNGFGRSRSSRKNRVNRDV